MKIAPRSQGLRLALLSGLALLWLSGCTLSGSRGLGDEVTPVTGEEGGTPGTGVPQVPVVVTTVAPLPTTPAPQGEGELSDLEVLGTQAAATATAQAAGATGGQAATGETGLTPAPAVTTGLGGEIAPVATTPAPAAPVVASGACPATHTVAQGENLYRIALRYGTTYQDLATANNIANPDQISVGLVLNIPSCGGAATTGGTTTTGTTTGGGTTHVVQPGENLFRIALQYNLLWTSLAAANNIQNPNALVPGQTLQIP